MGFPKYYFQVHIAVLLFGCAGLFGKIVSSSAGTIVFGRAFFAALFLLIILMFSSKKLVIPAKKYKYLFLLNGVILALHWVSFFASIKYSTVSIGVITFSTFPVFTTLMEPLFFKEKFKYSDILLALICISGVYIILPEFNISSNYTIGILLGVFSGFSFSIISILSKDLTKNFSSNEISFYQNLIACMVLMPFYGVNLLNSDSNDIMMILFLGIIFTGIAHTLFINSMIGLKAKTASLIACLEPFYAIILSVFLLSEPLTLNLIIGGSLIITVSVYSSIRKD